MDKKTVIENKRFGCERALYHTQDALIRDCRFEGEEDGESCLKESSNIAVLRCLMDLRYPLWHVDGLEVQQCTMTKNCRAALWYDRDVRLSQCDMNGIKALRECRNVVLGDIRADSPEFGWRCENIRADRCKITSEYAFLFSRNITADRLEFEGKYAFQYTQDVKITHSVFKTKDAFWHARNVTVEDSVLDGEYLGWYSEGLTLIRCRIVGTQPLCYCKGLRIVDCTTERCDLAFEYSEADAQIRGEILSVKNPLKGRIVADGYGELILTGGKYPVEAQILTRNKT